MPDNNDSIIASLGQQIPGPFSSVITSGLVPGSQPFTPAPPGLGYAGTTGKLAFIGDRIIQGLQRGKLMSYMAQEAQKQQSFKAGLAQIQAQKANPDITPQQRAGLDQLEAQWYAHYIQPDVAPQKQPKQKKSASGQNSSSGGGGQQQQQGDSPFEHIKNAIGSIVNRLGGPDLPKSGTPESQEWLSAQLQKIGAPSGQDQKFALQKQMMGISQGMQHAWSMAPGIGNIPSTAFPSGMLPQGSVTTDMVKANPDWQTAYMRLQQLDPKNADFYAAPSLMGLYNLPDQQRIDVNRQLLQGEADAQKYMNPPENREPVGANAGGGTRPGFNPKEPPGNGNFPGRASSGQVPATVQSPTAPQEKIPGNPLSAYYKPRTDNLANMSPETIKAYADQWGFKVGEPLYLTSPDGSDTPEVIQMTPNQSPRYLDPDTRQEVDVAAMKSAGWDLSRKDTRTTEGKDYWKDVPGTDTQLHFRLKAGKPIPIPDPGDPTKQETREMPAVAASRQRRIDRNDDRFTAGSEKAMEWQTEQYALIDRLPSNQNFQFNFPSPVEQKNEIARLRGDIDSNFQRRLDMLKIIRDDEEDRLNGKHTPLTPEKKLKISQGLFNPGNIKDTVTGELKQYDTLADGWKDLDNQLLIKVTGKDSRLRANATIRDLANLWAPASENDTEGYARKMASYLGVTPETPISQFKDRIRELSKAESFAEGTLNKMPPPATVDLSDIPKVILPGTITPQNPLVNVIIK